MSDSDPEKEDMNWKKAFALLLGLSLVISLVVLLLFPSVKISTKGIVGISLAQAAENFKPAYQNAIPNGQGSETGLSAFPPKLQTGGSKDNWLAVSAREFDIPVGSYTYGSSGFPATLNRNSTQSEVSYIRLSDNALVIKAGTFSDKCKYDIELAQYTLSGGESFASPIDSTPAVNELRAKFLSYVYGSGSDLYELEDVPQNDALPNLHGITAVRIYADVKAEAGQTKATASIRVGTGNKKYNGVVYDLTATGQRIVWEIPVNPATDKAWLWSEINPLQAGITLKTGICYELKAVVECQVGSQTVFPITPVECTPGSTGFQNVDLDTYVASLGADVTGVFLHYVDTSATTGYNVAFRKEGSTDNRVQILYNGSHAWAAIGVDSNHIFEVNVAHVTDMDVYIVAYTKTGVTFNTNATDRSLTGTGTWTDITIGAAGVTGAIIEIEPPWPYYTAGLRCNGSTDALLYQFTNHNGITAIIGCDVNQKIEGYINNTNQNFWETGYFTDGATFNVNATNVSIGTTGAYTDLTALPATAIMGFYEVHSGGVSARLYALRKNGTAEDIYRWCTFHCWAFVESASLIVEEEIDNISLDTYVSGYATAGATVALTNSENSWAMGTIAINTTYFWTADALVPAEPLADGDMKSTITNTGSEAEDIDIKCADFTGGVGWNISDDDSPGANEVNLRAGITGMANRAAMVQVVNTDTELINSLAASGTKMWCMELETGTSHTDGVAKNGVVTLTASVAD